MSDFQLKINSLNWLKAMGLKYYCSDTKDHELLRANFFARNQATATHKLDESYQIDSMKSDIVSSDEFNIKRTEPSLAGSKQTIHNDMLKSKSTCYKGLTMQKTLVENENSPIFQARRLADSANTIDELKEIVMNFEMCNLKKMALNTVFSDGNPNGAYMFIGEAPGGTEDKRGIPFCGESGKLLDNILASIDVSRKTNAYITNTVFWRPPANRAPTQEEIDICRPFVEKHIALVNPKIIILVGSVAATCLLGKHAGITKIRHEYYSYSNQYLTAPITTTAIFHPAYLLRQPMQKKTMWYDLLKIKKYVQENKILEQITV